MGYITWTREQCFFIGISLAGGKGRLTNGESNKFLDTSGSGGLQARAGSNLYIDGQEVVVNEETLARNKLYPSTRWVFSAEQKKWLIAGLIAGFFQPTKRPERWAYLTFIVDEEYAMGEGEYDIYIKPPNSSQSTSKRLDEDEPWPPPVPYPPPDEEDDIPDWWEDPEHPPEKLEPDEDGEYNLIPGYEYIIIGRVPNPPVPPPGKVIIDEEETIGVDQPDKKKPTYTEFIDPADQRRKCKIVLDVGHNQIEIIFDYDDKLEGENWYRVGAEITIRAIPASGWNFVYWRINEADIIETESHTFTVYSDSTYSAKFREIKASKMEGLKPVEPEITPDQPITYVITIFANKDYGTGSFTGAGVYEENTQVTLTATPDSDTARVDWWLNGELIAENTHSIDITVTEDAEYEVRFVEIDYNGLVGNYDSLADNKRTIIVNTLVPYPTFTVSELGYISSGCVGCFDALANTSDTEIDNQMV